MLSFGRLAQSKQFMLLNFLPEGIFYITLNSVNILYINWTSEICFLESMLTEWTCSQSILRVGLLNELSWNIDLCYKRIVDKLAGTQSSRVCTFVSYAQNFNWIYLTVIFSIDVFVSLFVKDEILLCLPWKQGRAINY